MGALISIVVPTYRSAGTLGQTLLSLSEQSMQSFEVIIVDGGSSDGTLDVAKSFQERLPRLIVSSRRDEGVYDAVNSALRVAKGEWVLILGSDDTLYSKDTLREVSSHLEACDELFVYGDVLLKGPTSWAKDGQRYDGQFDLKKILRKNICQQAVFYRRDLFHRIGEFNARYKVCADWDFALRVFSRFPARYIPVIVCVFAGGGISSGPADEAFEEDRFGLLLDYFGLRVVSGAFSSMRWEFRTWSIRALRRRQFVRAAASYLAYCALGVRARFVD